MHLVLPLIAAIAFASGSLVFKRAFAEGATLSHAVVLNNVVLGILFLPLMALDPTPIPWDRIHLPCLTAASFVTGHLLNVAALRAGDVSVATPLLGVKVVFVALIARFAFGWPLSTGQLVAAGLTSAGVLVTGLTDLKPGGRAGRSRPEADGLPLLRAALVSLSAPRGAWRWIALATTLSAIQAVLVAGTIAVWRDAAGVNVVYGTRGLWSLALVWWAGSWFGNAERRDSGPSVLAARAIGAALILSAVVLALRSSPIAGR